MLNIRFGEDDASLLLEEKMWARMQKDRNQRSRSGGIFNLGDDSGKSEVLTHRGQALGNDNDEGGFGAQGDEDDELDAEVVDQLHFGGNGDGDPRGPHPQVRAKLCDTSTAAYAARRYFMFLRGLSIKRRQKRQSSWERGTQKILNRECSLTRL